MGIPELEEQEMLLYLLTIPSFRPPVITFGGNIVVMSVWAYETMSSLRAKVMSSSFCVPTAQKRTWPEQLLSELALNRRLWG